MSLWERQRGKPQTCKGVAENAKTARILRVRRVRTRAAIDRKALAREAQKDSAAGVASGPLPPFFRFHRKPVVLWLDRDPDCYERGYRDGLEKGKSDD